VTSQFPQVLAGRYEIRDLIGRGGMAEVHLGYDTRLSRGVGIQLARSAHNTDVTQVRSLRGTALVRLFHLAGHAPEPEPIDFDDDTRYDGRGY